MIAACVFAVDPRERVAVHAAGHVAAVALADEAASSVAHG